MELLIAALLFAAAVLTHALLSRTRGGVGTVRSFFLVGCAYGLVLLLWHAFAETFNVAPILLYALSCELYIFVFTLAANSVSLGIAVRLLEGPAPISELFVSYSTDEMVERRLMHLEAAGLILRSNAGWKITSKGSTLVRAFRILRMTFRQARDENRVHPCAG